MKSKEELVLQEVNRCKSDFIYFAENYLKILDKNDKLVPLTFNTAQSRLHRTIESGEHFIKILKARQLGSSTYIAARFFWEALFNTNMRIAVIAHSDAGVKNIFNIYQRFYANLPAFLKIKQVKDSASQIEFVTGSLIKVGTANSENFRGSTYSRIHASEAAFWADMSSTIQSLFQTASNNPIIIVETTPNGLNEFYTFWKENNGYFPLFLSWLDHDEYKLSKLPKDGDKPTQLEVEFSKEHRLDNEQANWFIRTLRTRCSNNLTTFKTEYPATEQEAFIATGAFVFPQFAGRLSSKPTYRGWKLYKQPSKYASYTMGIDVASGSPNGDYTAITILDITNKDKIEIVGTFYDKITSKELVEIVKRTVSQYEGLIVAERNNYGLILIDELKDFGYPYMYREVKFDKFKNQYTDNLGFYTSVQTRPLIIAKLTEYINSNRIRIDDERLVYELTNFIYSSKGRAEAEKNFHDDLIFSLGLGLVGIDQAITMEEEIRKAKRPTSTREIVEFELATGTAFSNIPEDYWDDARPDEESVSIHDVY
jgi:hypothetical protein